MEFGRFGNQDGEDRRVYDDVMILAVYRRGIWTGSFSLLRKLVFFWIRFFPRADGGRMVREYCVRVVSVVLSRVSPSGGWNLVSDYVEEGRPHV